MKNKLNILKIFLIITLLLLPITLTSAQEPTEVNVPKIKQGEPYRLTFPCEDANGLCPTTSICRASAFKPDQSQFFNNLTATFNGTYYNVTIPGVHPLGLYRNEVVCYNGSAWGFDTIWIKITPTGDTRGFSLPIILGLGGFILLFTALFYRNPYFGIISGFLFGLAGVYLVIYGINDIADLYTRGLGWVSIGIGIIFIIVGAYESALEGKDEEE